MVRHRIANPTLRKGRVGSTPTLSAKFCGYDVMVAYDLAKVNVRVRFSLPAPQFWKVMQRGWSCDWP